VNDWLRTGYGGPLPAVGRHRYFYSCMRWMLVLAGFGQADQSGGGKGNAWAYSRSCGADGKYQRSH